MFFRENDANGQRIDYHAAFSGQLRLVPSGATQESLADDYASMLAKGMLGRAVRHPHAAMRSDRGESQHAWLE